MNLETEGDKKRNRFFRYLCGSNKTRKDQETITELCNLLLFKKKLDNSIKILFAFIKPTYLQIIIAVLRFSRASIIKAFLANAFFIPKQCFYPNYFPLSFPNELVIDNFFMTIS